MSDYPYGNSASPSDSYRSMRSASPSPSDVTSDWISPRQANLTNPRPGDTTSEESPPLHVVTTIYDEADRLVSMYGLMPPSRFQAFVRRLPNDGTAHWQTIELPGSEPLRVLMWMDTTDPAQDIEVPRTPKATKQDPEEAPEELYCGDNDYGIVVDPSPAEY